MTEPTRGQWRGYAVLCVLLLLALLVLIFWPRAERRPATSDHSVLKEAVARYGDSIEAQVADERLRRQSRRWRNDSERRYAERVHERRHEEGDFERRAVRKPDYEGVVELNSADTGQLMQLRGIGSTFARRIVSYRTLLGGYVRKEQLLEVYGMTRERYEAFAGHVVVDTSLVTKIAVNSATIGDMKRHPYIDYYQAKALSDYRRKGGRINDMSDLLKVNLFDDSVLIKLQGYIQFN